MSPTDSKPRRSKRARPCAEALESRALLTGGAGDTFAIVSGTIPQPGGTVTIPFTIDPAHFSVPRGRLTLGVDVATPQTSTAQPWIDIVLDPSSKPIRSTTHPLLTASMRQGKSAQGNETGGVITVLNLPRGKAAKPVTFAVQVSALNNTSGKFLLGFYLPGDANGDGKVDPTDIKAIQAGLNQVSTSQNYNFDADANRDGKVDRADIALARQDLGVWTDVSPDLSSQLDPASVTSKVARETTVPIARFMGNGTPGATITYQATDQPSPPVTTQVDSTGNYAIMTPLKPGTNTFQVTSNDAFGQTISGKVTPVVLDAGPTTAAPKTTTAINPAAATATTTASTPAPTTPATAPNPALEVMGPPPSGTAAAATATPSSSTRKVARATPRGPSAVVKRTPRHKVSFPFY